MKDAPDSATVELVYGVEHDGQTVCELVMRPPLARDSRDAQRGSSTQAESEFNLFANLCQQPVAVIERLQMADYIRLQKAYEGFLA